MGELAEWQERYAFQRAASTGANSERPERRAPEPKLRSIGSTRGSTRGGRPSPNLGPEPNDQGDEGDDDRSSGDTEASAIRRAPELSMQSSTGGARAKVAEQVDIPTWLKPLHHRSWRLNVVEPVVAASAVPDLAFFS